MTKHIRSVFEPGDLVSHNGKRYTIEDISKSGAILIGDDTGYFEYVKADQIKLIRPVAMDKVEAKIESIRQTLNSVANERQSILRDWAIRTYGIYEGAVICNEHNYYKVAGFSFDKKLAVHCHKWNDITLDWHPKASTIFPDFDIASYDAADWAEKRIKNIKRYKNGG